ncbi:MAG: Hsp70 family protein [Myxococcales bacterium]|nr:MAG: Hsp70 family protein [Myxococcales bacterium]
MSPRPLFVGIDLGTSNSVAAVFDGQTVQLVRNAQGSHLTPSIVRLDARGHVSVGARARRFLDGDPANTRAEFKRLMGTGARLDFPAAGASKRPEELAAEVLRSLLADVRDQTGVTVERAVISVPALFEVPQSNATVEAARLAGLTHVELIQEPIASALAAGWSADESPGRWLVYDLGGGTFDASLLETSEGFLRVVGHEGDNFLGGRDLDAAIVDWALGRLERQGLSRDDATHAAALRRLRAAAEEAKIELGRASEAALVLPDLIDGLDVDLTLDRATLESLAAPIIERSVAVCQRLLERHGMAAGKLQRIVLVGGPTAMPFLRRRVAEELGAPVTEGLDPMTLVAHGAALFAASSALDGRPAAAPAPIAGAHKVQLHYPTLASDLTPHVVGRVIEPGPGPALARLTLVRDDGWTSEPVALDAQGGFVASVELRPRQACQFTLRGEAADGSPVELSPDALTIVQGLTVSDPPLSRSLGVALASDAVQVYFERGSPLPARRTFSLTTVESVARGADVAVLTIPLVQGELPRAHLCRLVGALEIRGSALSASLPAGSTVELTIEVDRGGRLSARAFVPAISQAFDGVAHLLVPEASVETLTRAHASCAERLTALRAAAFKDAHAPTLRTAHRLDADLRTAAYYRDPSAWPDELAHLASRLDSSTDLPRARELFAEGQAALDRRDLPALRAVVEKLWRLLPVDARQRRQGYDSGVV